MEKKVSRNGHLSFSFCSWFQGQICPKNKGGLSLRLQNQFQNKGQWPFIYVHTKCWMNSQKGYVFRKEELVKKTCGLKVGLPVKDNKKHGRPTIDLSSQYYFVATKEDRVSKVHQSSSLPIYFGIHFSQSLQYFFLQTANSAETGSFIKLLHNHYGYYYL